MSVTFSKEGPCKNASNLQITRLTWCQIASGAGSYNQNPEGAGSRDGGGGRREEAGGLGGRGG